MKNKRKSSKPGYIAFAVFVAFVIVSGFALKAADYIDNPFDDIAFTVHWPTGGEQPLADALGQNGVTSSSAETDHDLSDNSTSGTKPQFQLPPVNDLAVNSTSGTKPQFQLPPVNDLTDSSVKADTGFSGTDDGRNDIKWSDLGEVFYDLWFICATTAVFIVVQYLFKLSVKQFKNHLPTATAAK